MNFWLAIAATVIVEAYALRRLKFDWVIVFTVMTGTLVSANYATYTAIHERNYDGPSQIYYIDTVARGLALPPALTCAACGHPPLYYELAALWSKTVLAGDWLARDRGLQWLSMLLFFGFVVFALLIFRKTIERPATMRLAAALVVFWPSSIINAVRVHNDALASMLMIAAVYYIGKLDKSDRLSDFNLAVAASALALLTKATGYAVVATLLVFVALRFGERGFRRETAVRFVTATVTFFVAALLPGVFREPSYPLSPCQKILGNACNVPRDSQVANSITDFLYFDLGGFVRHVSHASVLAGPPRRDYFWNGLAKSSLFGMMPLGEDFEGGRYGDLFVLLGLLLLTMVISCVAGLFHMRSSKWRRHRVIIVASGAMLGLLIAVRFVLPNPFHEDFRHIFPVLVPFCMLYAKVVERFGRWSNVLRQSGMAIGLSMVVASIAFVVRVS